MAAIETLADEVATNLEEVAVVTRQINGQSVTYFLGGVAIGVGVGFYVGVKLTKKKIRAEVLKEADEEITAMRELYQQKMVAMENSDKPSPAEAVREHGHSLPDPGNIPDYGNPSGGVTNYSTFPVPQERERSLPAPVPVMMPVVPVILDDLPENPTGTSKSKNAGWSYPQEMENRTEEQPYVIHQDEYTAATKGYSRVTYTYYEPDGVLVDEADERPVPHGDLVVGQENLKFGHGTDDADVVFVRNDRLEIDIEICRSSKSYEEEVLGSSDNENT